jgi:uncharacterized ubiquitin-like protein YukD
MDNKEEKITIHCKFLTGTSVTQTVSRDTTIEDVKKGVEEKEGISHKSLWLIHSAKLLENDKTLKDYDIKNGDYLNILLRLSQENKNTEVDSTV